MIRAWVLTLTLLVLAPQFAQAGCDECHFPMAKLYGTWEAGGNVLILKQRARQGNSVIVDVALIASKSNSIVAQGHGVGNVNNTDLRVQLLFTNGTHKVFMVSAMENQQIRINLGSIPVEGTRCNATSECREFNLVPNSFFDNDNDFFGEHPDPLVITQYDFE